MAVCVWSENASRSSRLLPSAEWKCCTTPVRNVSEVDLNAWLASSEYALGRLRGVAEQRGSEEERKRGREGERRSVGSRGERRV